MITDGGRKSSIKHIASFSLLLLALPFLELQHNRAAAAPSRQDARVVSVNDGDTVTIVMNNRRYRTRLIGIDAPEMGQEPWGKKSREHLRSLIKEVKWQVSVETDIEQYDKYNRLLVYIWTGDNQLISEKMLADGYAVLFTIQPNSKYADRFKRAQQIAREKRLGIWGQKGLKERPLDYKKKHPRE